ncbi:hypothetical protein CYMTET_17527, partial [Cymbomonas tetramitiformis]
MYCGGGEGHLGGQMLSADGSASNESSAYNQSSATARLPSEVLEQIHAGLEAVCQALPRDMWPEEWHQATEALEPGMDGSVPNVAVQLDRDAIRWVRTTKPGDAHNDQLSELRSRLTRLGVVPTTFIAHESTSQESYPYDAATPARHHTAPATMPLMSSELRDPLERSWDQDKWNASSIQRSGQSSLKMSPSLELSQTYGKCKSLLNSREQTLPEDDSDHDEDVEEEQRGTLEEIQMDTVIDDSQHGETMFCHIPMNDVWEVQQVIELVAEMAETTDNASQAPWNPLVSIKEEMSWLAYTLLQLQHLTLQSQLQEVGLLALDEEMPDIQQHLSAESFPGKSVSAIAGFQGLPPRMLLVTAPNHLLEHRAEANGYHKQVIHREDGTFVGGFCPQQFIRKGPLQPFYVATKIDPYNYYPYFAAQPAQVFLASEKLVLVHDFVSSPISDVYHSDGTIDPRQGGADIFIRELRSEGVVLDSFALMPLSGMYKLHYQWAMPWVHFGWKSYLTKWLYWQDLDEIQNYFGNRIVFYFAFMGHYTHYMHVLFLVTMILTLVDYASNYKLSSLRAFLMALFVSCWSILLLEQWKKRRNYLEYKWDNGVANSTRSHRVRPEYVFQLRKYIAKENLLEYVKEGLLVDAIPDDEWANGHLEGQRKRKEHFNPKVIMSDMEKYNEAYFLPKTQSRLEILTSVLYLGFFSFLSTLVTGGCQALDGLLEAHYNPPIYLPYGQSITTAKAVSGVVNGLLIPLLTFFYRQAAVHRTDREYHRTDVDYESALIMKLFLFQFFNQYNSLFWIAFYERDGEHLRVQLFSLLVSRIFINNAQEVLLPVGSIFWKEYFAGRPFWKAVWRLLVFCTGRVKHTGRQMVVKVFSIKLFQRLRWYSEAVHINQKTERLWASGEAQLRGRLYPPCIPHASPGVSQHGSSPWFQASRLQLQQPSPVVPQTPFIARRWPQSSDLDAARGPSVAVVMCDDAG